MVVTNGTGGQVTAGDGSPARQQRGLPGRAVRERQHRVWATTPPPTGRWSGPRSSSRTTSPRSFLRHDHDRAGRAAREPRGLRPAEPAADVQRLSLNSRRLRADRAHVDVALGLFVFWPALALGSFLNVVAARVPLRRSVVRPRSACMSCGNELAWYDNVPVVSWLVLRGRCRSCGERIAPLYPRSSWPRPALVAACFVTFGLSGEAFAGRLLLRRARRADARSTSTHRIVPNRIVLPGGGDRAPRPDRARPEPRVDAGRARRRRLPVRRRARVPGRDGHGRRQARAAPRRDAGAPRRRSG